MARARRAATSSSTPSPTGATRCPTRAPGFLEHVEGWCERGRQRARRLGRRPLLRDGPRQALGPHAEGLRPARARPRPSTTPTAASRRVRAAYERGETDEFIEPDDRRRRGAHPPRRLGHRLQLPPRPHARDHARAGRARLRRGRPRRRRAGRALRDADRVRGGLALPGRLPARAPRDHAAARHRRSAAAASCTSPRPRSTRT